MDYDLAKRLKDAGFPFKEHDDDFLNELNGGLGYSATLEELIEACGDDLDDIQRGADLPTERDKWYACRRQKNLLGKDIMALDGKSPIEAVANLWIALHQKNQKEG